MPGRSRAFTLADLTAFIALVAIFAALALAAGRQMRQEAMNASSLSQLRWMAGATSAYAADNGDRFWSYSWKEGPLPHSDPTLPATAASDLQAAAIQAVDILRRRGGRSDIELPASWIPHVLYNHLPLVDYVGTRLPDFNLVAPGNKHRLNWARDPAAFDRGEFLPFQPEPGEAAKRWPYSSSYMASVGMWDLAEESFDRVSQGATQSFWIVPGNTKLGGADLGEIAFPSQKVMIYDTEQRDLGSGGLFFADAHARTALLMGDGSTGVRATADANWGWHPNVPESRSYLRFQYIPSAWEAPVGPHGSLVIGRYRWTRGGITGRDFGGPEIDTGQS